MGTSKFQSSKSVLILTNYWPTYQNPISGIFIAQQAEAFAAKGIHCDILFLATRFKKSQDLLSIADLGLDYKMISLRKVQVFKLPDKLSSLSGAIWLNNLTVGKTLSRVVHDLTKLKQYDGCIIQSIRYAGLCISQWVRWVHCPVISILHGVDPFILKSTNLPVVRKILSSSHQNFKTVVLVGRLLRNYATKIGIPKSNQKIVANGVVFPTKTFLRDIPEVSGRPVRILSVSNLIPLKGIDLNLNALAQIAEQYPELSWEYLIVGDGPIRKDLENLTKQLNLESCVHFLGRLSYKDTQMQMARTDIFSLPSWNEAFGIVYLEAMANGVPVIGCYENGAADIVTAGLDGLLVRPKSTEDLKDSLFMLVSNAELRSKIGSCAKETVKKYTWSRNVDELLELLSIKKAK